VPAAFPRIVIATSISGGVLVACLFPSFDGLKDGGEPSEGGPAAVETGGGSVDGGPRSDSGVGPPKDGASVTEPDAADAGGGQGFIACGNVFCVVGVSFCCFGDTPGCVNESSSDDCGLLDDEVRCDDSNDCPTGKFCCEDFGNAVCADNCPGDRYCRSKEGCPADKDCTVQRGNGLKACTR